MSAAGFKITKFEAWKCLHLSGRPIRLDIEMLCVCGRRGSLPVMFDTRSELEADKYYGVNGYNAAQMFEDIGEFSEDHLREDGYNEDQIRQIRKPYAA